MNKFVISSLLVAASLSNRALAAYIPVSTANSEVKWQGSKGVKALGVHYGPIAIKEAKVDIDDKGLIKDAEIEIDMTKIGNDDLSGGMKDQLIGHLKSKDFFDVENFKTAKFNANSVKKLDNGKYEFKGDLTIKGITKPITFIGNYTKQESKYKLKGSFKFNRTDYQIKYGSGQFFTNLGDKMIHDEVFVSFDLVTQ